MRSVPTAHHTYDQPATEDQNEAARNQLDLRLLELSDIRSEGKKLAAETAYELLRGLIDPLQDTPSALRLLNSLVEEEWIAKALALGPLPELPVKDDVKENKYIVIVTGCRRTGVRRHEIDKFGVCFDEALQRHCLQDGKQALLGVLDSKNPKRAPSKIDHEAIDHISFRESTATLEHIYRDGYVHGDLVAAPPHHKTICIRFPSASKADTFLLQLQETYPDKKQSLNHSQLRFLPSLYTIHSISIDGGILAATDVGETLFLSSDHTAVLTLGKDGFTRPQQCRFRFSTRHIFYTRCNWDFPGVTYMHADGRIVSITTKPHDAAKWFQHDFGCRV